MRALALVAAVLLATASEAGAVTPQEVSEGFSEGVSNYCLKAISSGVSVAQLPEAARVGLTPSSGRQKEMLGSDKQAPAWDVPPAKGVVMVYEPAPGVCAVIGYGPPVELTFEETLRRTETSNPGFKRIHLEPGYDPIRMGLERTIGSNTQRIVLSGAEPGTPGHQFRFSMLEARVTKGDSAESSTQSLPMAEPAQSSFAYASAQQAFLEGVKFCEAISSDLKGQTAEKVLASSHFVATRQEDDLLAIAPFALDMQPRSGLLRKALMTNSNLGQIYAFIAVTNKNRPVCRVLAVNAPGAETSAKSYMDSADGVWSVKAKTDDVGSATTTYWRKIEGFRPGLSATVARLNKPGANVTAVALFSLPKE